MFQLEAQREPSSTTVRTVKVLWSAQSPPALRYEPSKSCGLPRALQHYEPSSTTVRTVEVLWSAQSPPARRYEPLKSCGLPRALQHDGTNRSRLVVCPEPSSTTVRTVARSRGQLSTLPHARSYALVVINVWTGVHERLTAGGPSGSWEGHNIGIRIWNTYCT
ncbi:unnamed protein product [Arctogadus glacialis]